MKSVNSRAQCLVNSGMKASLGKVKCYTDVKNSRKIILKFMYDL